MTESIPNASRTRLSTAASACCPRSTLPAVVTSSSDSALARAACLERRAALSTMELTTQPDRDEDDQRQDVVGLAMVNRWMGGVK